jgi:hypothetical protein
VSEDFGAKLSRWSQRKRAAARGVPVEDAPGDRRGEEQAALPPGQLPEAAAAGADANPAADEAMPALPPVEELTAESDYTVFLGEKVPEALKHAALRKLWRSDPVLANLDGLNDYDEDYNLVDSLITSVQSAYKAGKGYAEEAEEKLAQTEDIESGAAAEDVDSAAAAPTAAADENKNNAAVDDADTAPRQVGAGDEDDGAGGPVPHKPI